MEHTSPAMYTSYKRKTCEHVTRHFLFPRPFCACASRPSESTHKETICHVCSNFERLWKFVFVGDKSFNLYIFWHSFGARWCGLWNFHFYWLKRLGKYFFHILYVEMINDCFWKVYILKKVKMGNTKIKKFLLSNKVIHCAVRDLVWWFYVFSYILLLAIWK